MGLLGGGGAKKIGTKKNRENTFSYCFFLRKLSGSLELFLKRSIPVRFCSKKCIGDSKFQKK